MAVKLNLLPQDYIVSGPVSHILKIARPLNVILLGIFLASAMGVAIYFVLSSITLKKLNSEVNLLKSQINSHKTAQQQAVLLKDRVDKIAQIWEKTNTDKNLILIEPILSDESENKHISELSIDSQKIDLTMGFSSNSVLTDFFTKVTSQTSFSGILMNSFTYNPESGYGVSLSFNGRE